MPNANYKFLLFEIIPVESNALSRPSPQRLLAHLEGFSRDSPQLRRHDPVNGFQVRVFLMTGCPNLRWKSSRRCRISRPAHLRWIGQRSLRTTCLTRSALVPVLLVDGFLSLGSSCTSSCPFLNLLCHSKVQGARHRLISVHQSAVVRVASDGVVSLLCSHCLTAQNLGTVNKSMWKKHTMAAESGNCSYIPPGYDNTVMQATNAYRTHSLHSTLRPITFLTLLLYHLCKCKLDIFKRTLNL